MVVVALVAVFRNLGWFPERGPLLGRMLAPIDSAIVLRWLSVLAVRRQPFDAALGLLAARYPQPLIRKRLSIAVADVLCGRDWAASLRSAKILNRTDTAIVRAAARVGNLPWALREAASNMERRLNYRLAALGQALFPFLILAIGAAVMLFVVAWFLPLIDLIQSLAVPGGHGR